MISLKTKNWTIENIETILFDKDGTFIDLHYFWGKMTELRAQEIITKYNLPTETFSKLCLYLGYDTNSGKMLKDGITALYSRKIIIEIFTKNLINLGLEITEKDVETIFDSVNKKFYQEMTKYTKPINSAIEFIKKIRSYKVKTGIVTSDSKESTMLTLNHFDWENLFDVVIGRESTTETKESGIPTKLALEIINANPKTCVMIGDAPMDFLSAQNAEVEKTILISTGQIELEELLQLSPYCVESLEEIEII